VSCFGGDSQQAGQRLQQLRETAARFDLAAMTRVGSAEELARAAECLDLLLLRPEPAQRSELLTAAGRCTRPLLLPLGSDPRATLAEVELILGEGNQQLALLDEEGLSLERLLTLQQQTHLPLFGRLADA